MRSSDLHNINKLYLESINWQDEVEPLPDAAAAPASIEFYERRAMRWLQHTDEDAMQTLLDQMQSDAGASEQMFCDVSRYILLTYGMNYDVQRVGDASTQDLMDMMEQAYGDVAIAKQGNAIHATSGEET